MWSSSGAEDVTTPVACKIRQLICANSPQRTRDALGAGMLAEAAVEAGLTVPVEVAESELGS